MQLRSVRSALFKVILVFKLIKTEIILKKRAIVTGGTQYTSELK